MKRLILTSQETAILKGFGQESEALFADIVIDVKLTLSEVRKGIESLKGMGYVTEIVKQKANKEVLKSPSSEVVEFSAFTTFENIFSESKTLTDIYKTVKLTNSGLSAQRTLKQNSSAVFLKKD